MCKTLAAIVAVFFAWPAFAGPCGNPAAIQAALSSKYGEIPQAVRRCGPNNMAICQEWINIDSGTWIWVIYPGDGSLCVLMTGRIGAQL